MFGEKDFMGISLNSLYTIDLRDLTERHVIKFEYCETDKMLADVQTKPLAKQKLQELRTAIGVIDN